ncbi:hypothetical protein Q3G72_014849 [Acer saccharum]|nr:hypothetical protein Q3G72_014849 [Acer saccharum]
MPEQTEGEGMYRMYKENPEIYTIERLAKDFKIARKTAHLVLFCVHARENILEPKWSANSNAFDEDSKVSDEFMKKYKKQLPRGSSDDEVYKLFYSQVVYDSEEE